MEIESIFFKIKNNNFYIQITLSKMPNTGEQKQDSTLQGE